MSSRKSPKLETNVTHGNVTKSEVNQFFAHRDETGKELAAKIGAKTRCNKHFLENVALIKEALFTSIDAAVEATKLSNEVAAKELQASVAIKESGFELTKAQVAQRLSDANLYHQGTALQNSAQRSLELMQIRHAGNEALLSAKHSTAIAQTLTDLDYKIKTQNAQIADSEFAHFTSSQLSGQHPAVAAKQFHKVENQNFSKQSNGGIFGFAKKVLGIS